jgi:Family of unknown function (DUF6338)
VIQFVAPGFFAYRAYGWRVPGTRSSQVALLLVSVALSLPLVATVSWFAARLGIDRDPLSVRYVLPLLVLSVAVGYGVGELRSKRWLRRWLLRAGFPYEPDAVLTATLQDLPVPGLVTVLFKDGRLLEGQPVRGTNDPSLEVQQLFLTYARWWDHADGRWEGEDTVPLGDEETPLGVLVNLSEVLTISAFGAPEVTTSQRPWNQPFIEPWARRTGSM